MVEAVRKMKLIVMLAVLSWFSSNHCSFLSLWASPTSLVLFALVKDKIYNVCLTLVQSSFKYLY